MPGAHSPVREPPMRHALPLCVLASVLMTALGGCDPQLIPNTDVPDNSENREVVRFVERYRLAMEQLGSEQGGSVAELLQLVSERYLDDNGTLETTDDRDYDRLRQELSEIAERILDVRYEMRYRRITYRPDRVLVDYTFTGRYKIATSDGDVWRRRLSDNRLELILERGEYRIISGM
jgi:hypothetical protein